eukprot:CAMPEP_0184752378 /NCGR_PEP_ID=MMETSP0315-20130426/43549_1 /TAXON_ID=101924 /ORGANISM="Rhodosorus marinus, Strain UTEX LB 2760" /LENGTH=59 /DNA_ID=CAMNT_0027231707 /DNA_START=137 /DNA_END=316 /DNA_ORIENTATION=+
MESKKQDSNDQGTKRVVLPNVYVHGMKVKNAQEQPKSDSIRKGSGSWEQDQQEAEGTGK